MENPESIARQLNYFAPIGLDGMNEVKLMNRRDTKYWFNKRFLADILSEISDSYYVLNIEGQNIMPYSTVYYDTPGDMMYLEHHNGRLNRYKVRKRQYVISGISFLEVKFKNNKGKTQKSRISIEGFQPQFTNNEKLFLQGHYPFGPEYLEPALSNTFSRITLVNMNFKERCTIDLNLHFQQNGSMVDLDKMVIIEIKSEGKPSDSKLSKVLRDKHIHASGFSKYCIGRALTEPTLKRNRFKQKLHYIEKTISTEHSNNPLNISI